MRRTGAIAVMLLVAFAGTVSGVIVVASVGSQCRFSQRQYDVLHAVIAEQNKPQTPSPAVLHALPELAPFFTPGSPQFKEAQRLANQRRDDAFAAQGSRPSC